MERLDTVTVAEKIVERVVTPYGALVVETLWNDMSVHFPVGTVRVCTPGYLSPEFPDPEYMTIEHMVDLRVNVLVLPDGTLDDITGRVEMFYPLPERGAR